MTSVVILIMVTIVCLILGLIFAAISLYTYQKDDIVLAFIFCVLALLVGVGIPTATITQAIERADSLDNYNRQRR